MPHAYGSHPRGAVVGAVGGEAVVPLHVVPGEPLRNQAGVEQLARQRQDGGAAAGGGGDEQAHLPSEGRGTHVLLGMLQPPAGGGVRRQGLVEAQRSVRTARCSCLQAMRTP